jgi:hypothetical protein
MRNMRGGIGSPRLFVLPSAFQQGQQVDLRYCFGLN